MEQAPKIKILVGYHKPAKLYKSEEFIPIHLGRALAPEALKEGQMTKADYQWLVDNMMGDDTGDNISHLNKAFAELTGIYWAWKNYDKLGNPDYIGFMHYRRHFSAEALAQYADYDITACFEIQRQKLKAQFIENHTKQPYDALFSLLSEKDKTEFRNYMNETDGYFYNMFIMKKAIFFRYCPWLFEILFKFHKNTDYTKLSFYNQRMPGYLAERLTGCFIKQYPYRVNRCLVQLKDEPVLQYISPCFTNKAINICLASDDHYAPYLAVTIQSIKANNKSNSNYDICVLENNISSDNKRKILSLCQENFSIRFINIKSFLADIDINIFAENAHFTETTYFRFFIPQIFNNYSKIIYLDSDIAVHHDLAELFEINLNHKALAAALDTQMQKESFDKQNPYLSNKLQMKHPQTYFQAGVLLLDINQLQKMDFTNKCIERLRELKKPKYLDQCVLNALFDGDIVTLDPKWNVEGHTPDFVKDLDRRMRAEDYVKYIQARQNPYILHYCSIQKPWNNINLELADIWWQYARQTQFYEEIIYSNLKNSPETNTKELLRDVLNYSKNRFNYYRCMLLSIFAWGGGKKALQGKKEKIER